jgi:hypothetical protein
MNERKKGPATVDAGPNWPAQHRLRANLAAEKLFARNCDAMDREWEAWRQICKHLAQLGISVNEHTPLASAIRLWGEELVALRASAPEHTAQALAERREEYVPHVIRDGKP